MRRIVWLIEDNLGGGLPGSAPSYLRLVRTGRQPPRLDWTTESSYALQFARKEDAECFMLLYPNFCICSMPTDHVFIGEEEVREDG